MLMPLFMVRSALADSAQLSVGTGECVTDQSQTLYGPGPLNISISCTPTSGGAPVNGSLTGIATANYLTTGSGADLTFSSSNGGGAYVEIGSYDPDFQISGAPPGTPMALTFYGYFGGSYSYSTGYEVLEGLTAQIGIDTSNGVTFLLNDTQRFGFCDGDDACDGLPSYYTNSASGSGSLTVPFQSITYDMTEGQSGILALTSDFTQSTSAFGGYASSFTGDFLDPFTITNIAVTDPTTGQPLSGISITGAYGISYPVNVSSVPEPSSLGLLSAIILIGFVFRLYASIHSRARMLIGC
jgi:hypothetical protein